MNRATSIREVHANPCRDAIAPWPWKIPVAAQLRSADAALSGEPGVPVAGLPEEVLLEGELHRVRLRPGDEDPVLAWRQHLVGQDDHAVVPGVHHAHRRDV